MTKILRPDLVKFCNGERISVVFDGDGEQADEQKNRPATAIELESENQESIVPPAAVQPEQKTVISGEKVLADSKLPGTKPKGKSKPVGKGKIADQALKGFDDLPDSGHVDVRVVAALFGCSVPTVWRRVRSGQLVAPHKLGKRTTRWKVGELRDALRKGSSSPAEETPTPVAPPPLAGSSLENKAKRTKLADHGNEQQANATNPADIPQDSTSRDQVNAPNATRTVHSTKLRRNDLDTAIDKAIGKAGNDSSADIFPLLREMALVEDLPFTGQVDGGKLFYRNADGEKAFLTKSKLDSRLSRRRNPKR